MRLRFHCFVNLFKSTWINQSWFSLLVVSSFSVFPRFSVFFSVFSCVCSFMWRLIICISSRDKNMFVCLTHMHTFCITLSFLVSAFHCLFLMVQSLHSFLWVPEVFKKITSRFRFFRFFFMIFVEWVSSSWNHRFFWFLCCNWTLRLHQTFFSVVSTTLLHLLKAGDDKCFSFNWNSHVSLCVAALVQMLNSRIHHRRFTFFLPVTCFTDAEHKGYDEINDCAHTCGHWYLE